MKPNYNRNAKKIVRPQKQVRQRIAMVDAKMAVSGCQVFVGHPNPEYAKVVAKKYAQFLAETMAHARVPNMSDMYNAHFEMTHRLGQGESIPEITGEEDGQRQ